MDISKVEQKSIVYGTLKLYVDFWHNTIFYNKIEVYGLDKIDFNKPRILAPNHQNALMDPMAILGTRRDQPVFVARSDIFTHPLIVKFLLFIKILPIYRIRDGKAKLALNDKIFKKSVDILEKKKTLIVFPEAAHSPKRTLIPIKKGIFRIAFAAEEKNNFTLDTIIYPAGIIYSNYFPYKSNLLIQYGTPINVSKYKKDYAESPQKAMQIIRKDLGDEMERLAIHIKNQEHYTFFESARELFDNQTKECQKSSTDNSLLAKFKADKAIIRVLDKEYDEKPETIQNLDSETQLYFQKLKKNKLKDWLFDKPFSPFSLVLKTLLGIILFPIFAVGLIFFMIPFLAPEAIAPKFKDPQWHSSVRFAVSLIFGNIYGLIIFALLWIFVDIWWVKWVYLVGLTPLVQFSFWYRKSAPKVIGQWRFLFNKKIVENLKQERQKLKDKFALLYNKHENNA